eukprot:Gb_15781 [translate_table: standard]
MKSPKSPKSPPTPKSTRYNFLTEALSPVDDNDSVFDEETGLGDWGSDREESSPTHANARRLGHENMDAASTSSKATSKLYL